MLITLLMIHVFALILSACANNNDAMSPVSCSDNPTYCQNNFQINSTMANFPFVENANISDMRQFQKMMMTEFPWSPLVYFKSKCYSFAGSNCKSIQIMIQQIADNKYNIAIRGLAVNPGYNVYWGNNNLMQNMASSTVTFPAVAQGRTRNGVTSIRFQQQTQNAYNGFSHAGFEHTLNHLYLDTDGPLSNGTVTARLYYNGGGGSALVLTASLIKGRDYP